MKKRDFLVKALTDPMVIEEGNIQYPWLISLLAITRRKRQQYEEVKPWQLVFEGEVARVYVPTDGTLREDVIDDYVPGKPLFTKDEIIEIHPGEVLNNPATSTIKTTVGNLIANVLLLCYPFKKKIPYMNKRMDVGKIEDMVANVKNLRDDPGPGETPSDDPEIFYPFEYIKFTDAVGFLTRLDGVLVPSLTEASLSAPPGADERREQLVEANKDKLDDLATLVNIQNELTDMDKQYLKNDPVMGILIKPGKDFSIVRSRLFMTHGHVNGFKDGQPEYITDPLSKGYKLSEMDKWVNIARAGSYSRGAETQLGGVSVKQAMRATSNLSVNQKIQDCGTVHGYTVTLTPKLAKYYVDYYGIIGGKTVKLTKEFLEQNINNKITVRAPHYCIAEGETFCPVCLGNNLSKHPKGLSSAITSLSSAFMYLMMKAMHGKVSKTVRLDYKRLIS